MTSLLDDARESVLSKVANLEGDDDFAPFMLINGAKTAYVALEMPEWGQPRDNVADVMTALLAAHRATEAVFASVAWMLSIAPEERQEWGNRSFEEHPNRQEAVFLVHIGTGNRDGFHTAPVQRTGNKVSLGEWEDMTGERATAGGRFANAMRAGMQIGAMIAADPEMVEYIDKAMAADDPVWTVLAPMISAFRRIRAGDYTAEEFEEARRMAEGIQATDD